MSFKEYVLHIVTGKGTNVPLGRMFLFSMISIFLVNFLTNTLLIFATTSVATQAFLTSLDFAPTLIVLIVGVVILPIYEEVVFRLFLVPTQTKILISTSLITGMLIGYILMSVYGVGEKNPILVLVVLPVILAPIIALLMLLPFKQGLYPPERISTLLKMENALNKDIRPVYYISAILFSAAHIVFQKLLLPMTTTIMVIIFLNYFLVGLILGNVRISKGIGYSIITHSLVNFLAYLKVWL